jgi:hypothetical protein
VEVHRVAVGVGAHQTPRRPDGTVEVARVELAGRAPRIAQPLLQPGEAVDVADLEADVVQAGRARQQVHDVVARAPAEAGATAGQVGRRHQPQHPAVELGGGRDVGHAQTDVRGRRTAQRAGGLRFVQCHAGRT